MSNQAADNIRGRGKERPLWLTEVMRKTLTDCTEAQHVAMQQSLELFERTLFTHDDGRTEPVMVSFSLQMNGRDCTLRIPLLALVPLPFMQISQANLDFYVNVMSSESRKWQGLEVRFKSMTFLSVVSAIFLSIRFTSRRYPYFLLGLFSLR